MALIRTPSHLYRSLCRLCYFIYQFAQIDELNRSLEIKVEERTQELVQTQGYLVQSGKMAALGELIAGLAHEINNPLGVVNSNHQTLKRAITKLEKNTDNILQVIINRTKLNKIIKIVKELSSANIEAIQRIEYIMNNLRKFIRLDEAAVVKANLHECFDTTLTILNHEIQGRIKIIKDYSDLPEIFCRASEINQVIMNVLLNAVQAVQTTGQIIIRTGQNQKHVWIEISDNGKGISKENLTKIFYPGFSTKGDKIGLGLGLSISRQILEGHHGAISVKSEPGKGSKFLIELPKTLYEIS